VRVAPRALILTLVLASGCGSATHADTPSTNPSEGFAPVTTTPATFEAIGPPELPATTTGSSAPPPTSEDPPSADPLADLVIAPAAADAGYDRGLFEHWIDADHNGCDTRCEVLKRDRRTDLPGLREGWLSIYDGYSTDDATELDVDHVVALAEAWRSGADGWDATRRRDFANDLNDPSALRAVTSASNSAKGDYDPTNWRPPDRSVWCEWAQGYVRVKVHWRLTADATEAAALRSILTSC
jgi:hypothetical protein